MNVCTKCGNEYQPNYVTGDLCLDCWKEEYRKNRIKDSGERTTFSTGAVRDMHAGKGRMDLLPWAAIIEVSKHCENGAKKYGEHNVSLGHSHA